MGVEPVDAHGDELVAEIDLVERLHDVLARLHLVGGRDRVLKGRADDVGGAFGRLSKNFTWLPGRNSLER